MTRRPSLKDVLRPFEVEVRGSLRQLTRPRRTHQGGCYREALSFILGTGEADGARLVHGTLFAGTCPHAWVELPGDVVFDGVFQRFWRGLAYRERTSARAGKKYTLREAAAISLVSKTCGPWTDEEERQAGGGAALKPPAEPEPPRPRGRPRKPEAPADDATATLPPDDMPPVQRKPRGRKPPRPRGG